MPRTFRALSYVKTYTTNVMLLGTSTSLAYAELAPGAHPRQLKNIRGELQFTTSDTTASPADAAQGWVGLLRWPAAENLQGSEVNLEDPRLLHPVTWNFRHYPGHLRYEFKGINLALQDKFYLVVHKGFHTGGDSVYVDYVLQWAQLNHPVTA